MANGYSGQGGAGSPTIKTSADGGTVSGQTTITPDPTLNLVAGAGITLNGTSSNTILISSSGGGGGSGTVTSVALSGGTTGLTATGSPITTSGTITLGGTLALANGGTGATTASGARTNLGLGTASVEDTSAFATAAQGVLADSATQPGDNVSTLTNDAGYTTNAGTVTSVATGTGLSGGPVTTTGTISLANTAVTAGDYTSADITVDAQGRITAASNGSGGGVTLSGSTNNTISTVTGANALQGEANLTFDGTTLTTTGFTNTGNSSIGNAITDTVGFHGVTPVAQGTTTAYGGGGVPPGPDAIDLIALNAELTSIGNAITSIITLLTNLGLSS